MCGLAGYAINPQASGSVDLEALNEMGSSIFTRGPDDQGTFLSTDEKVGLVHQRLAIQDLSPLGAQPMQSNSGRYTLAFNGEIYNFKSIRDELASFGIDFRGGSDTEVMLAAFESWGVLESLAKFNGMFAISLVDLEERKLWLIRDRMGEKPLYYYRNEGVLVFGSELKALMACPHFVKDIEPGAIALLLKHNYIPAPWSIFKSTYKLEPAHFLKFDLNDLSADPEHHRYWNPRLSWDNNLTERSLHERLEGLLEDVIKDQMISDAPLGAFLSGGVDSSTIVALMQKASSTPVKTFSVGFDIDGFNEAEHARSVAEYLGTEHTEYYVAPQDALDIVPNLAKIYDEPFADSSQIPTYIVSQMTKKKVTVALSGDGGDELFAGYSRYTAYRDAFSKRRQGIANKALNSLPASAAMFLTKALKPNQRCLSSRLVKEKIAKYKLSYHSSKPQDFYRDQIAYWQNPIAAVEGSQRLSYSLDSIKEREDLISTFQWCDMNSYLPDDILVKVDRAAMANSLETRVPFLDHRLVELSLSVPTPLNFKNGMAKWPLRRILYQYVPSELIDRPKQGFAIPKAHWLRHELRDWAETLLSEESLTSVGYFNVSLVREKWLAHLNTEHDYSFHLWSILMFQAWHKEYMQ